MSENRGSNGPGPGANVDPVDPMTAAMAAPSAYGVEKLGQGTIAVDALSAGAAAGVAREEAELRAAIMVARHPSCRRDEVQALQRIRQSCSRPTFADTAEYSYPRGDKPVEGPSVQLARELARCWGNIIYDLRVVEVTADQIHLRAIAIDLETNVRVAAEDVFPKKVQRRGGWRATEDERDLRELTNRRGAILVRNCLLQLLPPDVVETARKDCRHTLTAHAAGQLEKDRDKAVQRILLAFEEVAVSRAMLERYLKHSLDQVEARELAELRRIYSSIMDGNSSPGEYFDGATPPSGGGGLAAKLEGDAADAAAGAETTATEAAAEAAPPAPGAGGAEAQPQEPAASSAPPAPPAPPPAPPAPPAAQPTTDLAGSSQRERLTALVAAYAGEAASMSKARTIGAHDELLEALDLEDVPGSLQSAMGAELGTGAAMATWKLVDHRAWLRWLLDRAKERLAGEAP